MKNILNWTLGGFFRTIGRYLAIGIIFFIISYFLSLSGFKLPSWLSIDMVNAQVIYDLDTNNSIFRYGVYGGAYPTTTNVCYGGENINNMSPLMKQLTQPSIEGYLQLNGGRGGFKTEDIFTLSQYDSFHKDFYRLELATYRKLSDGLYYYPGQTYNVSFLISSSVPLLLNSNGWTGSTKWYYSQGFDNSEVWYDSYQTATWTLLNNGGNMYWLTYQFSVPSGWNRGPLGVLFYFYIPSNQYIYCVDSPNNYYGEPNWFYINNAIIQDSNFDSTLLTFPSDNVVDNYWSNQDYVNPSSPGGGGDEGGITNEDINTSITNIYDMLDDTDTSQDSSDASDFFHNFNLSLEGPISQIVLLPINMLQYLVIDYNSNSSHADLCTTLKGQQICLPSGDILWKRNGSSSPFGVPNYVNFRTFFQLVVGGFIYYKLCRRLVASAEKGLDPQESGVNMIKL